MSCFRLVAPCIVLAALTSHPVVTSDQVARSRLVVTVLDQSGLVVPNAAVSVSEEAAEGVAAGAPVAETHSTGLGVAVFDALAEGRYTVRAEFPGFEPTTVSNVRVRGRESRIRAVLLIKKIDEAVTVGRDRQTASLDPRGSAFSSVLTREQIDALPDDPDEMEAALKALAPPGAVIRIDGFTGGKLPPKSQIRSIRLPRLDMFAAQNHGGMGGMVFIDIMTSPGNGPVRGNLDIHFLDDALNARNPFTAAKGAEQMRQYGYGLSGTIRPNKTAFSINGGGASQYTSPNLLAVLADGTRANANARQPGDNFNLMARLDHAINKDHALRASFDRTSSTSRNMGVGGYNLLERGFDTESTTNTLRLAENGPLGRRMFTESKLQVRWGTSETRSALEAPTVRVQDAFTAGGAQQKGGQRAVEFEASTDLDYVRGAHSWRTGVLVEGGSFKADDMTNYLGTYTFASLDDYRAGRPAGYTRRVGDPAIRYSSLQAAAYVQDDWRISRGLLFSSGVRFGSQNHVGDRWNVSPRLSFAWSPLRSGNVTVRASYGYFYDWISSDLYKQSLLFDGFRQQELNVADPAYPADALGATILPSNRYEWSERLTLPNAHRLSIGVDRAITQNSRLTANYGRGWGQGLLRGRNLNAPLGGARPDSAFANVVDLVADAGSRSESVGVHYGLVRMDLRRLFFAANYTWSRNTTNTAGAFAVPASGESLDTEWGPAQMDARHRVGASFSMAPVGNLTVGLNLRGQSGLPYDITTGRDDNADGVFNDRPAGVGRNAARGAGRWDLGGRVAYAWGFGTPKTSAGGGGQVIIREGGGGLAPGFGGGAADKRYRMEVYLSGQNLLNRANFTAYSFVLTSPFFGRPVAASQPRKLQAGLRFSF